MRLDKVKQVSPIDQGIITFIDNCLTPTTVRKEVMMPSSIYTYYLQFVDHYNIPQAHMLCLGKHLKQKFHSARGKKGTLYYCKVKDDLIS